MTGRRSSDEREYERLVDQLDALEEDIDAARATAAHSEAKPQLTIPVDHDRGGRLAAHGEDVVLSDGAHILVRQIEPADVTELERGFARLGALSRYRRFRAPVDHISHAEFAAAAGVDHECQEALVALDPVTGAGIAMAHFARDSSDSSRAEFDCTVLDSWQRRGVGTVLTQRLARLADAAGIDSLTAHVLVGNDGARRLLTRVGDVSTERRDGGVLKVRVKLRKATAA